MVAEDPQGIRLIAAFSEPRKEEGQLAACNHGWERQVVPEDDSIVTRGWISALTGYLSYVGPSVVIARWVGDIRMAIK